MQSIRKFVDQRPAGLLFQEAVEVNPARYGSTIVCRGISEQVIILKADRAEGMAAIFGDARHPGRNPIPYLGLSGTLSTPAIAALGDETGVLSVNLYDRRTRFSRTLAMRLFFHQAVDTDQSAAVIQGINSLVVNPELFGAGALIIVMPDLAGLYDLLKNIEVIVAGRADHGHADVGAQMKPVRNRRLPFILRGESEPGGIQIVQSQIGGQAKDRVGILFQRLKIEAIE